MLFTLQAGAATFPRQNFLQPQSGIYSQFMSRITLVLLLLVSLSGGCRQPMTGPGAQGPLFGGGNAAAWPAVSQNGGLFANGGQYPQNPNPAPDNAQIQQLASQYESLNSRLGQFNSDNENLHTQIAAMQQRLQNANNYNDSLRQQLADTMNQLQQSQAQSQQATAAAQQQIAANQQPSQATGPWSNASAATGATIRANNGLMERLQTVQLPGFKSWMDGDVIRIEGPTDRLFVSGSYQINSNDAMTIANLANAIRQNFPQQLVGVEAHWDGSPIQPATTSHHQLTATQALAVFDLLVKSGLPHEQVFTMALGSNRPRYNNASVQNGISPNRRIEIVIYPETYR